MLGRDILGAGVVSVGLGGTALGMSFSTDFPSVLATAIVGTATMVFGVWLMGSSFSNAEEVSADA